MSQRSSASLSSIRTRARRPARPFRATHARRRPVSQRSSAGSTTTRTATSAKTSTTSSPTSNAPTRTCRCSTRCTPRYAISRRIPNGATWLKGPNGAARASCAGRRGADRPTFRATVTSKRLAERPDNRRAGPWAACADVAIRNGGCCSKRSSRREARRVNCSLLRARPETAPGLAIGQGCGRARSTRPSRRGLG